MCGCLTASSCEYIPEAVELLKAILADMVLQARDAEFVGGIDIDADKCLHAAKFRLVDHCARDCDCYRSLYGYHGNFVCAV